ncbi:MAG TPA: pre-peptidase C-terminal domain-containing protein [Sedimentisphaerales bacterium]|nr:pre-peptidase C-terminal domain-containing protein [Sedimentisphaerales bacterium]
MNGLSQSRVRGLVALAALCLVASAAYGAPTSLSNGVPVTGISGAAGSEQFYMIAVPAGQDDLEIKISGGTGDCDLYVRRGAVPTTTTYDYRPYKVGNNETVLVESPAAGTWYIMLRGYTAFAGLTLQASYSASITVVTLNNGVSVTGLSDTTAGEKYYKIEVPSGQTKLQISISGGTGDCDLYVKQGALPTTTSYDYRPFLSGNNESVTVDSPTAGTWYIMLRAYSTYTGVTLLASYTGGVGTLLSNGVPVTGLSGAQASSRIYRIDVPAGQTNLEIKISGGTGDCDLYVKLGAAPTTTDYDYRPFLSGNEETVTVSNPTAGTWYIMLRGYSAYSGVTLVATYGTILTLEDNVPVSGISGSSGSEKVYKINVPSGQSVLEIKISGGSGNCDLYVRRGAVPTTSVWDYRPYLSGNNETVTVNNPQAGTWYIMLRARTAYSGVTLKADYWFTESVTVLSNGVPVTNISGAEGSEKLYRITVPAGQTKFEIEISGGTGDADLYVKRGAAPTTSDYEYRPYEIGNNEIVTIDNPPSGDWFIMLRGYHAYTGVTLVATYGGAGDTVTALNNGVPVTGLSGATGSEVYYKIDVPAGQAKLEIQTSGGTGDLDMYVRRGSKPTTTEWDYRPYLSGNNEIVTINSPAADTYYIMLRGYQAYTGATLVATYTPVSDPTVITLSNGVPVTGISGAAGSEKFYKIVVPAGQDFLNITISGGTGDCDLYVKRGAQPTTTSYDYRPYLIGNNESVDVTSPAAATWYIMLRAYQAYSGLTLVATYGTVAVGNDFTADPDCVALWRFETGQLTADSIGSNTLQTVETPTANATDHKEGEAAGDTQYGYFRIDDANLDTGFPLKSGAATTRFSVAFWFKARSGSSQVTGAGMFTKGAETGPYTYSFAIGLHEPGGAGTGTIILNVGTSDGSNLWLNNSGLTKIVQRDQWYHLAVTYEQTTSTSGTLKSYLYDPSDDSVATATIASTKIPVFNGPLALGILRWSTSRFDGLLDEVVVFKDILTPAEVNQIRQGSYGKP